MALKVVAVTLREHTVAIALALVPLTLVDVFVGVDHATFALGEPIDPVAVVAVAIFVEERAATVLFVLVPVASVLPPQFIAFLFPVGALAVTFVDGPHTFIFVAVRVELDAEALLAVVTPVPDVLLRGLPLLTADSAVFRLVLLFDPVH